MSDLKLSLYSAAPVWLQNAALTAYGYVLKHRRYGRGHRRILRELQRSQWLDGESLVRMQLDALNEMIRLARTVPLYRDRPLPDGRVTTLAELESIPLLTKDDLRRPGSELLSEAAPRRPLEIHTGGTTGKPLTVYCDHAALRRNYAFFERFKSWTGVRQGARIATFAGRTLVPRDATAAPYWRRNGAANTILFSSYHISRRTIPDYVDMLARFKPELIDSYPSSLAPIAAYVLEHGIEAIRPKAVITSSETLDELVRQSIERAFGCRVFDHYGAAEMAVLITQCDQGAYHVNPEFGIVEILRDGRPAKPGETGEIVATGLVNRVMPLIRYTTGDQATLGDGLCRCGRSFPIVERLEGRRDDVLVTPEGRLVGRLDPIFKSMAGLYETRIVQDRPDHVRVEAVTREEFTDADRLVLLQELRNRLGPAMLIDFVPVDRIPRTARGKFRSVVNETLTSPDGP